MCYIVIYRNEYILSHPYLGISKCSKRTKKEVKRLLLELRHP